MAIPIEHTKRKREILENALDVFIEEGYENTTFQKIADRCEITRTTLYIYFKNKQDIFMWSIKQMTDTLQSNLVKIVGDTTLSSEQTMRAILEKLIDSCQENRKLFMVVLPYLMQIKKVGVDPGERVRRRTIKLRRIMVHVIIKGIKNGEFKNQNVRDTNEILYGLIESSIFRLAVLNQPRIDEMKSVLNLAVDNILLK